MNRKTIFSHIGPVLALMMAAMASPAPAQPVTSSITPHADKLAAQMRILARDPRDVDALISAGILSVKLKDVPAALRFFQRAENEAPHDPRIIAGRASALVAVERPGEALQLFRKAEKAGIAPATFAADRGLAYDLLGYPHYAERDYRLALKSGADDETTRRLALSLAMQGKYDEASKLLEPMLRDQDRSAWLAEACVRAMAGDVDRATHIARTLLPDQGAEMKPFFRDLRGLSLPDRAFAVHFGQLHRTPTQLADARLATGLLSPDDRDRPVRLASTEPAADPTPARTAPGAGGEALAAVPMGGTTRADDDAVPEKAPARSIEYRLASSAMKPMADTRSDAKPAAPAPPPIDTDAVAAIMKRIVVPGTELAAAKVAKAAPARTAAATSPARSATATKPAHKAKAEASTKPAAKSEPARHWVQVAGGADKNALPRTWNRLEDQAPDLFKGKGAWTTPLRFTNRLLAGPFDSADAAQAFVNKLAGENISAFPFDSEAGQTIEKLDTE
ncbi:SPOR domain-containing protein [Stakelama saccharophila]|uniref:Tetratricopeptide repeat protein n=1 Tax=Stakelama saccharophila TaxID=3075605 RepID=A0ABZ0B731_9SPHN|nr:SPOR domain-containing protein [Stakelama sp. W311]WNO53104.1 tetratricopeptide repeat protein [Stakelama sp. W311]